MKKSEFKCLATLVTRAPGFLGFLRLVKNSNRKWNDYYADLIVSRIVLVGRNDPARTRGVCQTRNAGDPALTSLRRPSCRYRLSADPVAIKSLPSPGLLSTNLLFLDTCFGLGPSVSPATTRKGLAFGGWPWRHLLPQPREEGQALKGFFPRPMSSARSAPREAGRPALLEPGYPFILMRLGGSMRAVADQTRGGPARLSMGYISFWFQSCRAHRP